jgi:GNAT superfamily N-acetyltransferase
VAGVEFVDYAPEDPRLIADALPVLVQLRPHLSADDLRAVYAEGHPQGLRFTGAYDGTERCLAVAGWRLVATTASVRKLYVDDLVTDAAARSSGVGHTLLAELTRRAQAAGCHVIDLDSGVQRGDAHRFYFRERMSIVSLHFARALDS